MPFLRQFDIPGGPRDSRPWRNWHPYVAFPMTLLGTTVLLAPSLFVLSFLTGGLALLTWWVGACYVNREPWHGIIWWGTQALALVTLVCWAVIVIQEFRAGI